MSPLAAALLTAALALIGKLAYDAWGRYHERCSIAAGLAGEIGAYLSFFRGADAAKGYRALAGFALPERKTRLAVVPPLPSGHPVFDKVSGKLGMLPVTLAQEVSRIYNIVTAMRLVISNLSSDRFSQAHDASQTAVLQFIASTLDTNLPSANALVLALERESRRWPWKLIIGTVISIAVVGLIWYFGFFPGAAARIVCTD